MTVSQSPLLGIVQGCVQTNLRAESAKFIASLDTTGITIGGLLNLMKATFAHDERPIDETCDCYSCKTFTRAYIRQLIVAKELLAGTLISIHNLRALIRLMEQMRVYITDGTFESRVPELLEQWDNNARRSVGE